MTNFDALWDYNQPAETEAKFRALLDQWPNNDARLELLTQIARAQGLQRSFDEAHRTLDDVESSLARAGLRVRARYLLERGRVLNSSGVPGQREASLPLFEQALDVAAQAGADHFAVDAAHMLGIAAPADAQLDWNLKALAMAEASADPQANNWRGSLYNNIGWTYHDHGQYEAALDQFQRALAFRQAQGKPDQVRIARWCIARTLRSLGRADEALDLQQALLREHEAAGTTDGYVNEEIAECLTALGRVDEAKPHFQRAYDVLSQDAWLAANEAPRLERLQTLGQ